MGHLLFLDESGHGAGDGFVLGGVAVEMARWQPHAERWAREHRTPSRKHRPEVKWRSTGSDQGDAARLVRTLTQAGATAFAVVVDVAAIRSSETEPPADSQMIYKTALTFLLERFQRLLQRVDSHGVVVIDQRGGTLDDGLRRFFANLAATGTPYRSLDRILTPILLTPSEFALGVQAADIIAGSLYTTTWGGEAVSDKRRAVASRIHELLLPCFDRHPDTGEIDGVGIKRFPSPASARASARLFEPDALVAAAGARVASVDSAHTGP